ncbi:EpsG family protein [Cronobacter dublinensis]|nr:EpsG family protein [Cronobacter dublinensis]EKF2292187.1 EpsG family protein [Cronobacter dublinensis]EKF2295170.1 EpsG family protein [Cronobacter dublinensis]EKM0135986.1 EpsG family protein [Cronobacter dublinensis]EKM0148755.1 EpsG family protein [Cronobacter dublinensis]
MWLLQVVFIIIVPLCFAQTLTNNNYVYTRFNLVLFFIVLSVLAGLRISSPDYENYFTYFNLLSAGGDFKEINIVAPDPVFAYINYGLSYLWKDPVILFMTFSILSVGLNLKCFKDYSPYFFLCILLYVSHTYVAREMMQIRAGLSCAICLYSIRYILQRKILIFALLILLASSIHLGAIIFSCSYFIGNLNLSKKNIILILLASFCIAVIFPLGAVIKSLPNIDALSRVQYYSNSIYGMSSGVFNNLVIIKGLVIIALMLSYHEELCKCSKYYLVSFNLYVFSVVWYLLWNDFEIVAARIATFFSITEVLLLSYIPLLAKNKINKILCTIGIVLIAAIIFSLNQVTGKWDDVILPFYDFWEC